MPPAASASGHPDLSKHGRAPNKLMEVDDDGPVGWTLPALQVGVFSKTSDERRTPTARRWKPSRPAEALALSPVPVACTRAGGSDVWPSELANRSTPSIFKQEARNARPGRGQPRHPPGGWPIHLLPLSNSRRRTPPTVRQVRDHGGRLRWINRSRPSDPKPSSASFRSGGTPPKTNSRSWPFPVPRQRKTNPSSLTRHLRPKDFFQRLCVLPQGPGRRNSPRSTKALDDPADEVEERSVCLQIEDAAQQGAQRRLAQAIELLSLGTKPRQYQALKPGKDARSSSISCAANSPGCPISSPGRPHPSSAVPSSNFPRPSVIVGLRPSCASCRTCPLGSWWKSRASWRRREKSTTCAQPWLAGLASAPHPRKFSGGSARNAAGRYPSFSVYLSLPCLARWNVTNWRRSAPLVCMTSCSRIAALSAICSSPPSPTGCGCDAPAPAYACLR